jgi:hypothetical protein
MEAYQDAKTRLVQAGATPINWVAIICEWTPDFTTDEPHRVNPPVMTFDGRPCRVKYLVAQTDVGCSSWLAKAVRPRTAGRLQDSSAGAGSVPRPMMLS